MTGPASGYITVYTIEIALLFMTLVALGPLVRTVQARLRDDCRPTADEPTDTLRPQAHGVTTMKQGLLFDNIDLAQVVLYAFWIFFAGLILYLRREDKREGYPLESERSAYITVQGFPAIPSPKTFRLAGGGTVSVPRKEIDDREIRAKPVAPWLGAPLEPTGNPMIDGVGPAAYALRSTQPDITFDGHDRLVPLAGRQRPTSSSHAIPIRVAWR